VDKSGGMAAYTTLGFADVYPKTIIGEMIVSTEVILGGANARLLECPQFAVEHTKRQVAVCCAREKVIFLLDRTRTATISIDRAARRHRTNRNISGIVMFPSALLAIVGTK
jgi:hypothetical protein